jgi:RNA polymerase sigma factor (sigma-70 family)
MEGNNSANPEDSNKEFTESIDDKELVKRILAGEKNLYALIIRKYNQRLYRIGISIINNKMEVEDVMQTAYLKAYENLGKFKFQSSFSTWIAKILVNESLSHLKKQRQARKAKEKKQLPESKLSQVELQTPLLKLLNAELKALLETSIQQLPEKYRTVFVMRELENMSVAETMECLGISEANVKVRLNRAKVMLQTILRSYLNEDEILQLYSTHCDHMVDKVMDGIS